MLTKFLKFKKYLAISLIIFLFLINLQLVFAQPQDQQANTKPSTQTQQNQTTGNNQSNNQNQQNQAENNQSNNQTDQDKKEESTWGKIGSFFKGLTASAIAAATGGVIGFAVFVLNYIISFIAGAIIALEAWFIEVVLAMNDQIVQSSFVQSGFLISLSVANLIFVAGIIIIAIATILRWESYSIKKILWKLIVMAILVNFSLTLSGAIINISSSFSNYFLNAISPTSGQDGNLSFSKYNSFATTIAGIFTPQRLFIKNSQGLTSSVGDPNKIKEDQDLSQFAGEGLASNFKPLISVFFVILFLVNFIIILGALFIMLLIRYVALGFLLILAPLAWTMWIFENTKQYWTEWWKNFLKWTFFAPLVLFFLYLVMLSLRGTPGGSGGFITSSSNTTKINGVEFTFKSKNDGPLGAIQNFVGTVLGDITATFLQMIMAIGLTVGSLIAANRLGIKGAESGLSLANNINNSAKNWAKNRAKGSIAEGLTRTEPKQYTSGWRRIFNPINKLTYKATRPAAAIAERMGYAPKLQEVAEKYGSKTREKRKQNVRAAKNKIKNINAKIKNSPELIAKKKQEYQKQIEDETKKFEDEIQSTEKMIEDLTKDLNTKNLNENQQNEIKKKIEEERNKIQQLKKQRDTKIKELKEKLTTEITNLLPENLINERRKLYEAIAHPEAFEFELEKDESGEETVKQIKAKEKPGENLTFWGSIVEGATGKYKAKKKIKKKLNKKDLEEADLDEETLKNIAERLDIDIDIEDK
jgi:hypothetical protein